MSQWTYKNVSTKNGNTDGELMFDFLPEELGRTPVENKDILYELQMVFGHDFARGKIDIVFLTLQEFQFLTMKHGDFFVLRPALTQAAAMLTAAKALVPNPTTTQAQINARIAEMQEIVDYIQDAVSKSSEARAHALAHFSGISAGVGRFDSQNAIRVSNMNRTNDGSRIAILKLGPYERTALYFGKTTKDDSRATLAYRNICAGDNLFLGKKTFPAMTAMVGGAPHPEILPRQPIELSVERRNANPAVMFVVDDKMHTITLVPGTSVYYYFFTATHDFSATLRADRSNSFFPIGEIGVVHKINPLAPAADADFYHQIRSPAIQRSTFTVILTDRLFKEHRTAQSAPLMMIGTPFPESVVVEVPVPTKPAESTPTLKRTPVEAGLAPVASVTSSKVRKNAPATASGNPMS